MTWKKPEGFTLSRRLVQGGLWSVVATLVLCAVAAAPAAPAGLESLACAKPPGYNPTPPQGPPQSKVRVVNLYLNANGSPGAPLDFYESADPSTTEKAIISGLGYGQISPYVAPHAADRPKYVTTNYGDLFMFQHGCHFPSGKVDGAQSGEPIKEAGWVKGQQETVVIADGLQGLAAAPSFEYIMETEPKGDGYSMSLKPPAGKGMLILNTFGLINSTSTIPGAYLRVDGRCTGNFLIPGQTGQSNNGLLGGGIANNVPVTPGSHKLEVVASPHAGLGLTQATCDSAPTLAARTVTIAKGSPTMVFLYGPDPQHAKFIVTTIG
jgi:hypothetical protein